jgi:hypothetical protein
VRPAVRYYCPKGIARPAHRDDFVGEGAELLPGIGPDTVPPHGGTGEGRVWGGLYVPGEPGWVKTDAGWFVNLGTSLPQHLQRIHVHPRITRWTIVHGAQAEHRWRVPVLLTIEPSEDPDQPPTWVSALERVYRGADGWIEPGDLIDLQNRLHDVAQGVALRGRLDEEWQAITDLAIDLLALGQRISRHELAASAASPAGAWLSERMLLRTIVAASDQAVAAEAGG